MVFRPPAIRPVSPPVARAPAPASARKPVAEAMGPAAAVPRARTPTPATAPPAARVAHERVAEFAPENLAQLTGAWAYSPADCDKLLQRRGRALAYRRPVDKFEQAAIVKAQRIRLPSATCRIDRASKDSGALKASGDCQDSISHTSRTVYIRYQTQIRQRGRLQSDRRSGAGRHSDEAPALRA